MSFVGDDHRYTRGVGAIASMDAVSPRRRILAAMAARRMAARDAELARSTLGAVPKGQESPSRPPPPPPHHPPPPRPPHPLPPRFRVPLGQRLVKLPGSVIAPPAPGDTKPTQTNTSTAAPTAPPPPKPGATIVASAGMSPIVISKPPPSATLPPMTAVDEGGDAAPEPEASAPAAAKPSSKLLVYAALGLGAWWLLTRK